MKKIFSFLMAAMMLNSAAQTVVLAQDDVVAKESVVLEQKAEHEHEQEAADEAAPAKEEAELAASVTASGTCGDNLTWTLYDDGELVIDGKGKMYDYSISSTNCAPWYDYRESLKKITIGDEVASIGDYAFYKCTDLTSVNFANVSSIGDYAFDGCNRLTSVDFANVSSIGQSAFSGCKGLTSVDFANVSSIGTQAFLYCTGLTSVVIPESVKSIGAYAFECCSNLAKVTVYSRDVSYSVSYVVFNGCHAELTLYGYTGSTTVAYAEKYDFPFVALDEREIIASGTCGDNLTWTLYDDGELVIDGEGAMYDYSTSSSNLAPWFDYRESLKKITFGDGVASVGKYAFWYGLSSYTSPNITSVDFANVSSIGDEAFAYCTRLTSVDFANVSSIGTWAFYYCTGLTSVVLGKDLEFLGTYSFYGCSALKAISIPSKTTSIGDSTFAYCTSLDQVIIPTSVSTIDANAFNNSANVTIWCYTGSTAHKYAVAYSIPYVIMNGMIRIKAAAVNNLAIVFENVNNEFVGAVKGIEEGVLCSEVLNDLSSPAESHKLIVTDESGNEIDNTEIGVKTGYKVKAVDEVNNVVQEVLLVVEGDVNGDGVVNLADVNAASKEIRVLKEAEEANAQLAEEEAAKTYLIAADLDNDGSVSNEDMKSFLAIAGGFAVAK